jgi:SecD/SecF fusion protein
MKKFFRNIKDKYDKVWAKFYDPNTKISRHGKWYAIAPAVIALVGVILLCIPSVGLNLGIEYTGGTIVEVTRLSSEDTQTAARDRVANYLSGLENVSFDINTRNSAGDWGLSIKYSIDVNDTDAANRARADNILAEVLRLVRQDGSEIVNPSMQHTHDTIHPTASREIMMTTVIAVVISMIAIMAYMLVRFKFTSGIAAVVGLVHDVFVTIALCAIFRVEINYPFVAAIITVVVYSLNNTIVQFDRIRDKEKQLRISGSKYDVEHVVDSSIKEVFARTMSTSITTLVPVIVLCCLPIPLIRDFALPILFGLIAGTFSTIFVTSILYVRFERFRQRKNKNVKKIQRQDNLVSAE